MEAVLHKLQVKFPAISFEAGDSFFWTPKSRLITYRNEKSNQTINTWALLHETAHAALEHTSYSSDFELLLLEVAAWDKARELGTALGINIDDDHIQDCLDTYRDWLHQRSTCPSCSTTSFQKSPKEYHCHNCQTIWQVSASRFCRPYRLRDSPRKSKKSPGVSQATFM